ncbi:hypothetical protein [Vibrio casei]|uniref:hypothetical protein n=1 Tax=Vibrio casei TaxID=673372 RepID=UPI003F945F68
MNNNTLLAVIIVTMVTFTGYLMWLNNDMKKDNDRVKFEAYQLHIDKVNADKELLEARVKELNLIVDKGVYGYE